MNDNQINASHFCLVFSDECLVTYTALCEERADDSREDGDDKLNNSFPGLEIFEHCLKLSVES